MKDTYCLRINCSLDKLGQVEKVLDKKSDNSDTSLWEWSIKEDLRPTDAFNAFLDLLEGKYDDLAKIGLQKSNISIWRYYEYDQECNLEISPEQMINLGSKGIVLCISCWQHRQ